MTVKIISQEIQAAVSFNREYLGVILYFQVNRLHVVDTESHSFFQLVFLAAYCDYVVTIARVKLYAARLYGLVVV